MGENEITNLTVSGNESPGAAYAESPADEDQDEQLYILDEPSSDGGAGDGMDGMDLMEDLGMLVDSLNTARTFGTIGDYYHPVLGFYVFPDFDTWEYFIDIDAVGDEWAQASDGHYVEQLDLDVYEAYISGADLEEEMLTETDQQNMETLESINGTLSVVKQNLSVYCENVYEYQAQMLAGQEEMLAWQEIQTYSCIGCGVLAGVIAGSLLAEHLFGKMRL